MSPPHEQFFVKNLENVQGDERDVIFISIGYGRTAEGYLAMSFGPVNRAGGERRLNVLFSRARKRCEVFTTLCADDIDHGGNKGGGVYALKSFLRYAESGYHRRSGGNRTAAGLSIRRAGIECTPAARLYRSYASRDCRILPGHGRP